MLRCKIVEVLCLAEIANKTVDAKRSFCKIRTSSIMLKIKATGHNLVRQHVRLTKRMRSCIMQWICVYKFSLQRYSIYNVSFQVTWRERNIPYHSSRTIFQEHKTRSCCNKRGNNIGIKQFNIRRRKERWAFLSKKCKVYFYHLPANKRNNVQKADLSLTISLLSTTKGRRTNNVPDPKHKILIKGPQKLLTLYHVPELTPRWENLTDRHWLKIAFLLILKFMFFIWKLFSFRRLFIFWNDSS